MVAIVAFCWSQRAVRAVCFVGGEETKENELKFEKSMVLYMLIGLLLLVVKGSYSVFVFNIVLKASLW